MHQHSQQQQALMQAAAAYNPANITTEHIQQYLDENKALILKILESQNLGKMNECAENQQRLQQNLMYLAAIADCQPQAASLHNHFFPNAIVQPGAGYMQQQQQQQQNQQQQNPVMVPRLPLLYSQQQQQQYSAMQQQSMHAQLGMGTVPQKFRMTQNDQSAAAGSIRNFSDFGRLTSGEGLQAMNKGIGYGSRQDGDGRAGTSGGPGADKTEVYQGY